MPSAATSRPSTVPLTVILPALKSPLESRATMVLAVFASVAFDVTVNVAPSAEAEPDNPVPDTAPAAT